MAISHRSISLFSLLKSPVENWIASNFFSVSPCLRGSNSSSNQFTFSVLFCTLVALFAIPSVLQADEKFESQPYRVLVSVAFDNDAALSRNYRRATLQNLADVIDRSYGSMWQANVVENDWLSPASGVGLQRVTLDHFKSPVDTARFDKAFLVTVEMPGSRYAVSGRQWDATTRTIGPLVSAETFDRRDVGATAADVIRRLFQPVLTVERVEGNTVILRVQAGRFSPADPKAAQIRPGDVIQPFFRYLDEKQAVRSIQTLPWTYLIADSVDGGRVKCSLVSGLRSPLSSSRRRSVDVIALRIRPHFDSTRLKLVPRGNRSKPLIGYSVEAVAKRFANDKPKGKPLKRMTDRRGAVDISTMTDGPLVWLYIRSGQSLLSRVPFVPGVAQAQTIELPDDSIRLAVEGETDLLVIRLVDTVARRAVLIARARILAREGDWKHVDEQVAKIDKLPVIKNFESDLTLIRVPALEAAVRDKNRSAEANVNYICTRVSGLIKRYLDQAPVRTLKADIAELRKLDAEDKRLLEAK
jgi:hypothetical protein